MAFNNIDIAVFVFFGVLILGFSFWMSRQKRATERSSQDYFLASKSLPWWVIGASLIASNISAQQFIGMSGSGYVIGLGIASYELMAALTLIIVGKFFLPIYLSKGIYTMPQFLEIRFNHHVKTVVAIIFFLDNVFIALTTVLYLGGLAIETIMGIPLIYAVIGLAIIAALISVIGGLKSIAYVDLLQVFVLIGGGLLTTWFTLNAVSDGQGFFTGLKLLYEKAPEKFDMILTQDNPNYKYLPGISVLIGAMWIANLSYWGCNQYIIQRALAAKNVKEAQNGVLFAGFLKLLLPFVVVLPGIAAYVLKADIAKPDEAYPWLLNRYLYPGVKGIAVAALLTAIISSVASIANAVSTIYTMDLYKSLINKKASDKNLILTGRIATALALIIAIILSPLLRNIDQVFQFIQEFGGLLTPGYTAIFLFGLFWKRTTTKSVLWAGIDTIPLSLALKYAIPDVPFMDRIGIVFILLSAIIIISSLLESKSAHPNAVVLTQGIFATDRRFKIGAVIIIAILTAIYAIFW